MQQIVVAPICDFATAEARWRGTLVGPDDASVVVRGTMTRVITTDGEHLATLIPRAVPRPLAAVAYGHLRRIAAPVGGGNRRIASALPLKTESYGRVVNRAVPLATSESISAHSGIIGYFDRYARWPYCRQTAYNINHPTRWSALLPYFGVIDRVFAEHLPDRYLAQQEVVQQTHPDFVVSGTVFTTVTVNRNWQSAVHVDAGDLPEGSGVMSVLRAGSYSGGVLVFPRYRLGIDMHTGDVLLSNVHEWHGNTPIVGKTGRFTRVSCVFYYRRNMVECGSAAQELARAKARNLHGGPLRGKA